jgi:hypothetical protein
MGQEPQGLPPPGKELTWNRGMPSSGDKHMRDEQTLHALRYDVLFDILTPEERKGVEDAFRNYIAFHLSGHKPWHPDFRYDRTSWLPNMHWPRAIGTHVMAAALGDEKLIAAMFHAEGGWKWFFDSYIADGRFYMEEFCKYYSNIGTMLMWCEALERLGLSKYGYGYTGAGGANMKEYLQMLIYLGFPRLDSPAGTPTYPAVTMGDAGNTELVTGYSADGKGGNRIWSTAHMNGPMPKTQVPQWFEVGQKRWPDVGFDYFLAQLRRPGEDRYWPDLVFGHGLGPIAPAKVKPPPAPSYVAPERGFAMLRADESPAYWEGPGPAVALQFGMYYVHYVHDCFTLLGYVAKNRKIYWRMGRPPGRTGYAGGDPWCDHGRGQSTAVVDGLRAQPCDDGNHGCAGQRIRHRFAAPLKFVACRARGIFPDVDQERALFLTDEYLLDVFRLASEKPRVYDWQVLALGGLAGLDAAPWKPAAEYKGDLDVNKPFLSDIRVMEPGDGPWSADVVQTEAARGVGVRVRMLGEPGTAVLGSTPPGIQPGAGSSLLVTRRAPATVFAALHEPFEGGAAKAPATAFERIAQDGGGLAVRIVGKSGPVNDRVGLRWGEGVDQPLTLAGGGERFTFADHLFVRIGPDKVEAVGDLRAMKVRVEGRPHLVLNGKDAPARVEAGCLEYAP